MKQFYLKSLFLSLLMIVVGNVCASAEEETIASFTASTYNSGTTNGWTVSNANYATAGGGYYQLTYSNASIVTPSINWSEYSDITITIYARKFGGPDETQGKISVSQGETELASYSPSGTSIAASSALSISPVDGSITISCPGASGNKGCGVKEIVIKGTPAVSNKTLTGLMISGYPTEFYVGDEFTFGEEGTVTAVYDDNSTKVVTSKATFTGYDMNTAGIQTVTVSYTEGDITKTTDYNITVKERTLTGITLSGTYPTEFNVGDTFSHDGLIVTASYDDDSSEDVTDEVTFEGYDMSAPGEQTVTVSYTKGDVTKTATYNITVNAVTGDAYTLVTNANDLEEGDQVIIVNKDAKKAMSTTQNSNNRAATDVSFDVDGNAIVPSSTDIQVFTLESGVNNGWYFSTGDGYIYAASSSSNHLKTQNTKNDNAKASISISGNNATIEFQGNYSHNLLQYNSGSNLFSCYLNAQQPIQLYKKPGSTATLTEIALGGDYPTTFKIGDEFSHEGMTVIATFDDGTTKDVTSGAVFSEPDMSTAGTKTVTVSYTKGSVTKTATYDITVSAVQLTEITLSGDYPTTFNVGDEFSHEGMTVTASYDDSTTEDVTADATFEGYDMNTAGTQTVTVSYTKGEVTKTATYDITVSTVAVTGITLNVIEETLYVGQKLKITATIEPENASNKKLIWTSEDESVATVDENGEVTAVGVGTIIIKASAEDDNDIFGACTINVEELTGDAYTLVTSVADLKAGNTVIIVNKEDEKAMSTEQKTSNRSATSVFFNAEGQAVVPTSANIQVFTLEADPEGGWYFNTGSGYIYAASSTANQLKTETEKDDNAKASISISDEVATVVFQGSNTRNTLQYNPNNGSPIFSCYGSASQKPVQIYMREAEVTTYTLVATDNEGTETEYPFSGLTLTQEFPAWTSFYIKASDGSLYGSEDGDHYVITADNHENLNAKSYTSEDVTSNPFFFRRANSWVFTIAEATDGIKLTVNPESPEGTYYKMAADYSPSEPFQDTEDVFDEEGKLTKEMTTDPFYIVKTDDYDAYPLGANDSNVEDQNIWEFSGENNTVGFLEGEWMIKYRVSEADTYNFTLDLENKTITALPSVRKYTLVTSDGNETIFDNELKITGKEVPAQTEFYIKDNYGKTYYAEDGKNIISAENHENMDTYYPVEGNTPVKFYLMKANTWNFTLTEPTDEGATIKVTVTPQTPGETKYMLSETYLTESEDVFDENYQLTKEMEAGKAFYLERSDDYGITNMSAKENNTSDGSRNWDFSETANSVEFVIGEITNVYRMTEAGTYTFTLNFTNNTISVEKIPTTYTLVKNDNTEIAFEGLTLTTDALPAEAYFHIKDNFGNNYYAISTDEEIPYAVAITAENHDDLSTRVSTSDDIEDICRFFLGKQNTWVFTITPAEDGTIKLSVSPQTEGETKYMIADETPYTETENVFTEDGKLTKAMTTASFFIVKSDDYAIVPLVPAESNTEDESRHPVWEFSGTANQVGFSMGNPYALDNYTYPYRMSEADTYNFTLDLENKTVSVEKVLTTYTLMANEGDHWAEYEFDGLVLNEEFPNGTEFYIKDNKGNVYYGEYGNSIIYAENHENLNTYYPVEDETVTEKPKPFELRKNAIWHFTITEPTEDGETIKLTVVPSTIEEETKYMLSSEWMQTSEDVFDENFQITKEFTAGEAFFITREDGFGIFNVTAAESNVQEGAVVTRVWEFSEDAPTVGYVPAKTLNAFRVKDADLYTITLDTENQTVTIETVPTTYTLVTVDETLTEYPFSGLTLTKELPAHTEFYIKDNKGKVYYASNDLEEAIISAENHENLPTYVQGNNFALKKANTWVFTLTELTDAAGITLTVNPETAGETKYMITEDLNTETEDVFDENLQLTKEMTTTPFYIIRSDDYGLFELTAEERTNPEGYARFTFTEESNTATFIVGERRNMYEMSEAGTYTFTLDLENNKVTAEKYVETVDVPVTSAEWATFVAPKPVIFPDDVTAYVISSIEGNVAIGTQVTEVPAGTAVIVNATEGTHKAVVVEEATLEVTNMLLISDGTVTGDGTIWVLAVQDGEAGFARLATGKKLSAGKAYLQVAAAGAKLQFVVDDEATAIEGIKSAVDFSDGDWYNLRGVKVTTPQKGIYIHNGKKVIIK